MSTRADDTAKEWGKAISGPDIASLYAVVPRASLRCLRTAPL